MKIKTVCELTELTDRTVRYYIEEQLISPAYTENYLGRKSFDFSQDDVEKLNSISVLRKFDFTIEEIKEIASDAENSKVIIQNVKARTEQVVSTGQSRHQTLSKIEDNKAYTVAELATELLIAAKTLPKTKENIKVNLVKRILAAIKTALVLLLVWLPVAFQVFFLLATINYYTYPTFYPRVILYMVLSVLPSLFIPLLGGLRIKWKKAAKAVALIFCAISLLFSSTVFFFTPVGLLAISETTNIVDYGDLDADCLANHHRFYHELFPAQSHYFKNVKNAEGNYETVYLDAHYYYRYLSGFDYTYDIYAQWPLEKDEFDKEVARVKALYDSESDYETVQKGNYTCYFMYNGDPPFAPVTDSYTYYIFAYDEKNLVVRYIMCDSLDNGAEQPYYLSLDW